MGRFLRSVGIRFVSKEQMRDDSGLRTLRLVRHYRIPMFDLKALSCFRLDNNPVWINQRIQRIQGSFREVPFEEDAVSKRVLHLSVRVLHAVGLDSGLVSIGMGPKGMLYVLDVTANPVLEGRLLDLYATAVSDFIDREEQASRNGVGPVQLGADIEFMLRNGSGRMVLASSYLPRRGRVGCDDRSVQFDGKRLPLVELRPDPEYSPLGLLTNLRHVMSEASALINRSVVQWRGGSMPFRPYSTGAHIHFSNIPYSSHLVKVLDNYLGLPLMMVEDQRTALLRRPRYGFLGDVREKDYGGFEYRTPASFIVDKAVTAAALCIAYLIGINHKDLAVSDIYEPNLQTAFYQGNTEALLPVVERNFDFLRQLPLYERYRDYIEPLSQMIQARETWNESADVRTVWEIPLEKRVRQEARRRKPKARNVG